MLRLLFWHWEAPVFGLVEGLQGGGRCSMCADICTCGWGLLLLNHSRETNKEEWEMSRLTPRKQRNECKENLSSWLNHIYFLQLQLPKMCPDLQLVGGCRVTGVTSAARRKRKTQKLRKRITESIGQEIPNSRDIPNRSTATWRRVELKINQPRAACPQTLKASSVFVFPVVVTESARFSATVLCCRPVR